jgi:cysteine desulfuration protein SufE
MTMTHDMPASLREHVDLLGFAEDRSQRIQMLIDIGEGFQEVPETVASRPFDEALRVPACESQVFVWATPRPDGTLDYHFAVENPQGLSAKAMASILGDALSGAPLAEVAEIDPEIVFEVFGKDLSLGKSLGLKGMVNMVRMYARRAMRSGAEPAR